MCGRKRKWKVFRKVINVKKEDPRRNKACRYIYAKITLQYRHGVAPLRAQWYGPRYPRLIPAQTPTGHRVPRFGAKLKSEMRNCVFYYLLNVCEFMRVTCLHIKCKRHPLLTPYAYTLPFMYLRNGVKGCIQSMRMLSGPKSERDSIADDSPLNGFDIPFAPSDPKDVLLLYSKEAAFDESMRDIWIRNFLIAAHPLPAAIDVNFFRIRIPRGWEMHNLCHVNLNFVGFFRCIPSTNQLLLMSVNDFCS